MAFAALTAAGALASAGANIYGAANANNTGAELQYRLGLQNLNQAEAASAYQRLVNQLALQRSIAGQEDSFGTTLRYDPATNTWVTQYGALPEAAQRSAYQAGVTRNTTDVARAEQANDLAVGRALSSADASDAAMRGIRNFQPVSGNQLASLMYERAGMANRDATDPLIRDTLRTYARMGTSAGPVLSQIGRQSAEDLRKAAIESTMAGMKGASEINNANQGGLLSRYTTLNANATPTLQYPGIQTDDTNKIVAQLAAQRAATAGNTGAYLSQTATSGQSGINAATAGAMGAVPNSNLDNAKVKGIGDNIKSLVSGGKDLYSALFGKPYGSDSSGNAYSNPASQYKPVGAGDWYSEAPTTFKSGV